jgi:hypothetical protein
VAECSRRHQRSESNTRGFAGQPSQCRPHVCRAGPSPATAWRARLAAVDPPPMDGVRPSSSRTTFRIANDTRNSESMVLMSRTIRGLSAVTYSPGLRGFEGTPDQLIVAVVLTSYCLIRPLPKEARLRRIYSRRFREDGVSRRGGRRSATPPVRGKEPDEDNPRGWRKIISAVPGVVPCCA